MDGIWFQQQRYFRASRFCKTGPPKAVLRKIFLFPFGRAYFPQKSCRKLIPNLFKLLKPDTIHTGSATAYKKKSKVMRSTEKNKKWNQKTSNLPLGIGASWLSWLKFGAAALGFCLFGSGFVWVVLAFLLCYDILRGILFCLASLIVLIGFFSFLFSLIF